MIKRQHVFKTLLHREDWSLGILAFTTIDRLQMLFWEQRKLIEQFYELMDHLLAELIDLDDQQTHVMVISPFGFHTVKKKFFVNEWLWELGLLSRSVSTGDAGIQNFYYDYFQKSNGHDRWLTNMLAHSHITKDNIRAIIPDTICDVARRITPAAIRKLFPRENLIINWERTKAYFPSYQTAGININLRGREPLGIVQPGAEYEELRDQIIHELYRLKDPHTFENVIAHVYRKEELFSGESLEHAPDILIIPREHHYYLDPNKRTARQYITIANDDYPVYGQRDSQGIIYLAGSRIRADYQIPEFSTMDVVPHVLHLLELPVPGDLDGRLRRQLFNDTDFADERTTVNLPDITANQSA